MAKTAYWLMVCLFLMSSCSQLQYEAPPPPQPYSSIGPPGIHLSYYKNILPAKEWQDMETLDYSRANFTFPPLAGYKMLYYENYWRQSQISLYREVIRRDKGDTFKDIIQRRQASDHCNFTRSFYKKLYDIDMLEAIADCSPWRREHISKYYFLKAGDIVYTFCLSGFPHDYLLAEPDFDLFVSTTVDNYLVYAPRQQLSPMSSQYAIHETEEGQPDWFSKEELVSFFDPTIAYNMFP